MPGLSAWAKNKVRKVGRVHAGDSIGNEDSVVAADEPSHQQPGAQLEEKKLEEAPESLLPATPSMRDLTADGPEVYENKPGCWSWFCAHYERMNTLQIHRVQLFPSEHESLVEKRELGNRSAQYLVWRSTLLHIGTLFFAAIVAFDILVLVVSLSDKGAEAQFLNQVDDRYDEYFSDLVLYTRLNTIFLLASSAISVIFAGIATLFWQTLPRSAPAVLVSFLFSYLPPFLLLLLIPFRSGVDFKGIQQQVCHDTVNGVWNTTKLWPLLGDDSFAQMLRDHTDIELPTDFCYTAPHRWGSIITRSIEQVGLLQHESGSCRRVDDHLASLNEAMNVSAVQYLMRQNTAGSKCPEDCSNCTVACRPYLLPLNMLVSREDGGSAAVAALGELRGSCIHCVQQSAALQCPQRCPGVHTELVRQATGGLPKAKDFCIDPTALHDFELLVRLGMQQSYWKALLGSLFAFISLAQLMPLALSLLMGAAKGSGIAKSVIPYSRLPNIVSASAAIFTFPFVLQLAIVIQTTIGTTLTLIGVLLLLSAIIASMKPEILIASSHNDLERWENILGAVSKVCIVASLIIFAVAAFMSDVSSTAFKLACDQGLCITGDRLKLAMDQIIWNLARLVANFLGKSLISTVFFADGVVSLMHFFHYKESNDPIQVQCGRAVLVKDIHAMFGKKTSISESLFPDVERPDRTRRAEDVLEEQHAVVPLSALVNIQKMLNRAAQEQQKCRGASLPLHMDDAKLDMQALASNVARVVESTEVSVREMIRLQEARVRMRQVRNVGRLLRPMPNRALAVPRQAMGMPRQAWTRLQAVRAARSGKQEASG